jgi:hypothetical protein
MARLLRALDICTVAELISACGLIVLVNLFHLFSSPNVIYPFRCAPARQILTARQPRVAALLRHGSTPPVSPSSQARKQTDSQPESTLALLPISSTSSEFCSRAAAGARHRTPQQIEIDPSCYRIASTGRD